jgi:superfamily II DNA or RNA helicase
MHEVSLNDAINEYEVLSPYKYSLHIVSLSDDERQRYRDLSQELVSRYEDAKSYDGQPMQEVADRNSRVRSTMQERVAVLKECEEKTAVTAENIGSIGTRTIIFANDEDHMREVKDRIDQQTGRSTAVFYGKLNQQTRDERLDRFEAGDIEVLASIDCLTEGIDVPDCDSAIIIANSQSERKAVQRRGRVLRESEKSDYAELHDFLVLPVPKNKLEGNADLVDSEINLVKNELDRVERMNEEADNAEENNVRIQQLRMTLNKYSDNA